MKRILASALMLTMSAMTAVAAVPSQYNVNTAIPTGIDSSTGNATVPYVDHATGAMTVQVNGASSSGVVQVSEVGGVTASSVSTASSAVVDTTTLRFPMTVTVIPVSGTNTATIEFATTPNAASSPGAANWQVLGTVSGVATTNSVTLPSPVTALQFIRASGTGSVVGEWDW